MNARVLIIEDEVELAELIQLYLNDEGIESTACSSAEDGLAELSRADFDLIVLDINLPGMDGFEFLAQIRRTKDVPVIIVSAREADEDIVLGLGVGADEFVTKPFAPKVLVARIRALLRRVRGARKQSVAFGPYELDPDGYVVTREGARVALSSREFEVLRYLVLNPGKAMSPEDIYRDVWHNEYGDTTSVAVYVRRIRQKIEDDPRNPVYVQTIHGSGYRFNSERVRPAVESE
ncbi:MAG: response regulator transcription factor [Spirochaetota bacterium]